MEDSDKRALGALALMVRQYLEERPDGLVDSLAMNAGECAIAVLSESGYMETIILGRTFGRWTDAGHALCQTLFNDTL